MTHLAARRPLGRVSHRGVVAPGQCTGPAGADDELVIVPQPVRPSRAGDADSVIDRRLAEVEAGAVQIGHEQGRRCRPAEVLGEPLDDHADKSRADARRLPEYFDHPIHPGLALEVEVDAVGPLRLVGRRAHDEAYRVCGHGRQVREAVALQDGEAAAVQKDTHDASRSGSKT